MAEPWFDPLWFGVLVGAIGGGVGGSLVGILGGLGGWLAPRGIGRPWILGAMALFTLLGLGLLTFGLVALTSGQPYGIWYPLLLPGLLFSLLCGGAFLGLRRVYALAEQRRLEAENFRRS